MLKTIMKMDKGREKQIIWPVIAVLLCTFCFFNEAKGDEKEQDNKSPIPSQLELIWSTNLSLERWTDQRDVTIRVYPWGKACIADAVVTDRKAPDVPVEQKVYALGADGNELFRKFYIDLPFVFAYGHFKAAGQNMYRWFDRYENPGPLGLRYHVWLDGSGNILWVEAQRFDERRHHPNTVTANEDGTISAFTARCDGASCQVDRLRVSEKGIDREGWKSVTVWDLPGYDRNTYQYEVVGVGDSYMMIFQRRLGHKATEGEREYRLVRFDRNGRTISASRHLFPARHDTMATHNIAFTLSPDGSFLYFTISGRTGAFLSIDQKGKETWKTNVGLPLDLTIGPSSLRPFEDGWLLEGRVRSFVPGQPLIHNGDVALLRFSPNGKLLWHFRLKRPNEEGMKYIGTIEKHIFFSKGRSLFCYQEKHTK